MTKKKNTTIEYENDWFKVVKNDKYHYIVENTEDNSAVVLIEIDDSYLFVNVKRAPFDFDECLELPRGCGEKQETSSHTAIREVLEETGYLLKEIRLLGKVRPNSAILKSTVDIYYAKISSNQKKQEHDSEIESLTFIKKEKIKEMIRESEIVDGFTLSAFALLFSSDL